MRKAIKSKCKTVIAWQLGMGTAKEKELIQEGKIRVLKDGEYEVFSREASEHGERVKTGAFVKTGVDGLLYPNDEAFFVSHHRHVSGDIYEQIPEPVDVWFVEDGYCPEIQFLIKHKGLRLNEESDTSYFQAPLWGTIETSPRDSALVFYSIKRGSDGCIQDADFNFVARDAFEKTYVFCLGDENE